MKPLRWVVLSLVAVLSLSVVWIDGQPAPDERVTAANQTAVSALAKRAVERRAVLDLNEQRRQEIVNDLEFSPPVPRPGPPQPPPGPPKFCLFPPPTPASAMDPHRSLFVHDRATLDAGPDFSLNRTLGQIATQVAPSVPGTTAVSIFRQLWDTQNTAATGVVANSPHCDDNGGTINGYPIQCPRAEGNEAVGTNAQLTTRMGDYKVLALVNRLDLAHQGWRNCGEFRIIYGKQAAGVRKNLIIFEAVLPNPRPGCREGCVPVAEFWKSLSSINSGLTRAQNLEKFFYAGLPGFRPVVHVSHYSATGVSGGYGSSGSGQIRTNQFLQSPWTLREYKTVIDCSVSPCVFNLVPIMVKVNPFPLLWNEDDPHPNGPDFRADTVAQLSRLSSSELMKIGYDVDLKHDDGESVSEVVGSFNDDYREHMNDAAGVAFRTLLSAGSLTADQIARRALTQSCHGCHQPPAFGLSLPGSIGMVMTPVGSPVATTDRWPDSLNFVHVDTNTPSGQPELLANPAAFGASGLGQAISPALRDFFLPERVNFLIAQLNAKRCPCKPKFRFLEPTLRARAFEIEARVHKQFADRMAELEKQHAALDVDRQKDTPRLRTQLLEERERILAEREKALVTELARAGVKLPEAEMLNLKPETLNLARTAAARTAAVNERLRREPPRRTVTGSFRPH
ncbi:MAG TPA: hypothetical protein VEK11_05080 [Thermoanaerobaculia bacterium]|nr:hypothetical protein [Thermoanaerobaculia bacterium]